MAARGDWSAFLAALGGLLLVVGIACWSFDHGVVSQEAFADKAVDALHHDPVRRAVSREIDAQVQPHVSPSDASPAEVRAIVNRTVRGTEFERVFRNGAITTNRALFHNDGTDATLLVNLAEVLRPTSPQLAQVVGDRDVTVLALDAGTALERTSRAGQIVGLFGVALPFWAAAALVGALFLAPRRIRVLGWAGLGAALTGAVLLAAVYVARAIAQSQIEMVGVSNALARDAAAATWSVYTADLRLIAIIAVVLGLVALAVGVVAGRTTSPRAAAGYASPPERRRA